MKYLVLQSGPKYTFNVIFQLLFSFKVFRSSICIFAQFNPHCTYVKGVTKTHYNLPFLGHHPKKDTSGWKNFQILNLFNFLSPPQENWCWIFFFFSFFDSAAQIKMWKFCDKIRSKRILCSEKVQSLILFKVLVGIVNFNISF